MLEAKKLGFKVGVHTSGAYPKRLIKILPLVDWVGFDIKAPSDLVDKITNREGSEKLTSESLEIILEQRKNRINSENPLDVQFRTTVDPTVISKSEVERLESELLEIGIDNLVLQEVRTIGAPKEYAEKLLKINQAKLSD
jgi:pyruvate formate lyase activating enzyme